MESFIGIITIDGKYYSTANDTLNESIPDRSIKEIRAEGVLDILLFLSGKRFKNLRTLTLFDCPMEKFILSTAVFPRLKKLSLDHNGLKYFDIVGKSRIKAINISNNLLSYIPSSIRRLKSLEKLCLERNDIEMVPKDLKYLRELKSIDLSYNKLMSFPTQLLHLPSLRYMSIRGIPFDGLIKLERSTIEFDFTGCALSIGNFKQLDPHIRIKGILSELFDNCDLPLSSDELEQMYITEEILLDLIVENVITKQEKYIDPDDVLEHEVLLDDSHSINEQMGYAILIMEYYQNLMPYQKEIHLSYSEAVYACKLLYKD